MIGRELPEVPQPAPDSTDDIDDGYRDLSAGLICALADNYTALLDRLSL